MELETDHVVEISVGTKNIASNVSIDRSLHERSKAKGPSHYKYGDIGIIKGVEL